MTRFCSFFTTSSLTKTALHVAGILLLSALYLIFGASADAQQLVKDINSHPDSFEFGEISKGHPSFSLFSFFSPDTGYEIYKTDGTSAGTGLLKDINPGPDGSYPYQFTVVGSLVFFAAYDPVHGQELWVSDGSAAGTHLVADIQPGFAGSNPENLTAYGTQGVVFSATTLSKGTELWYADATSATIAADLAPGSASSYPREITYSPTAFGPASPGIIFTAGISGNDEPYVSDILTTEIKEIRAGLGSSNPTGYTPLSTIGFVYSASDGASGVELWTSATNRATSRVKDLNSGASDSFPRSFARAGNKVVFVADDSDTHLWSTDGTVGGTSLVALDPSLTPSYLDYSPTIVSAGSRAYFSCLSDLKGLELCDTDGSTVELTRDIKPGAFSSNPQNLFNVNGTLYFGADDGSVGQELWKASGTTVSRVADINPNIASSFPNPLGSFGSRLVFVADTGRYNIFVTDGTSAGTRALLDLSANGSLASSPSSLTLFKGEAYFKASDGSHGAELWKSGGTSATTILVKDIAPGSDSSNPSNFTVSGGKFYFTATNELTGTELWVTDGTETGTTLVRDIQLGANSSNPSKLTDLNGTLIFSANDGSSGAELWASDGTVSGTILLNDIRPGSSSSGPLFLTKVGNSIFFSATGSTTDGAELWKTDGIAAHTVRVKDIRPGASSSTPSNLIALNDVLLFSANDGTNGTELWRSDGTEVGTTLLKDINTVVPLAGSSPSNFTLANGFVFFLASNGMNGKELWRSDGTASGTTLVKDINGTVADTDYGSFYWTGSRLYFTANDGVHGSELWTSDGTTAGTRLVKDIRTGAAGSNISQFSSYEGTLYFRADDSTGFGSELWKSDGTEVGTTRISDINPTGNASPGSFLPVNGNLLFSANDGVHGSELWSLAIDACPADTSKLSPGACGCGVPDVDANANGIFDCFKTPELKSRVKKLKTAVAAIQTARTARQKRAQRRANDAIKAALKELINYANANGAQVTVLGNTRLSRLTSDVKGKVTKVTTLRNLARYKSLARQALTRLEKALPS